MGIMNDFQEQQQFEDTRRGFLKKASLGFGSLALSSLLGPTNALAKAFPRTKDS
ncbi:MAG: twin-arginine translocation signal domain-containing protein, partial [Bacteroidota bacterium]